MPEDQEDNEHVHEALEGSVDPERIVEVLHDHVLLVCLPEEPDHSSQPDEFVEPCDSAEPRQAVDIAALGQQVKRQHRKQIECKPGL